jgi:hypothetical protein
VPDAWAKDFNRLLASIVSGIILLFARQQCLLSLDETEYSQNNKILRSLV